MPALQGYRVSSLPPSDVSLRPPPVPSFKPLPASSSMGNKGLATDQARSQNRKTIEKNATDYTAYLLSTFAKTMLETCEAPESIDQEMMSTPFMAEILGEAMVDSGAGDLLREDLLTSMLDMQAREGSKKRLSSSLPSSNNALSSSPRGPAVLIPATQESVVLQTSLKGETDATP